MDQVWIWLQKPMKVQWIWTWLQKPKASAAKMNLIAKSKGKWNKVWAQLQKPMVSAVNINFIVKAKGKWKKCEFGYKSQRQVQQTQGWWDEFKVYQLSFALNVLLLFLLDVCYSFFFFCKIANWYK